MDVLVTGLVNADLLEDVVLALPDVGLVFHAMLDNGLLENVNPASFASAKLIAPAVGCRKLALLPNLAGFPVVYCLTNSSKANESSPAIVSYTSDDGSGEAWTSAVVVSKAAGVTCTDWLMLKMARRDAAANGPPRRDFVLACNDSLVAALYIDEVGMLDVVLRNSSLVLHSLALFSSLEPPNSQPAGSTIGQNDSDVFVGCSTNANRVLFLRFDSTRATTQFAIVATLELDALIVSHVWTGDWDEDGMADLALLTSDLLELVFFRTLAFDLVAPASSFVLLNALTVPATFPTKFDVQLTNHSLSAWQFNPLAMRSFSDGGRSNAFFAVTQAFQADAYWPGSSSYSGYDIAGAFFSGWCFAVRASAPSLAMNKTMFSTLVRKVESWEQFPRAVSPPVLLEYVHYMSDRARA